MIDNLKIILPFIDFRSEDDFFFLQILQRKKENELLTANSHVIKNYYLTSRVQLLNLYPEIMSLCKKFNARASLRLNRRSFEQIAFQTLCTTANMIHSKDFKSIRRTYDRMCGKYNCEPDKKWILDIDSKGIDMDRIMTGVKFCQPNEGEEKHYCVLPTKSGYHIITKPFNVEQFKRTVRMELDIHKDNPVNLYIP